MTTLTLRVNPASDASSCRGPIETKDLGRGQGQAAFNQIP